MKNRRFVEVCAERRVETVGGLDLGADVIIRIFPSSSTTARQIKLQRFVQ
jgi:hypothetical protein